MTTNKTQTAPLDDAGAMAEKKRAQALPAPAKIVYANRRNTASVRTGHELGGYVKERWYSIGQMEEMQARATRAEAELANANTTVTELREELASLRVYVAANVERASRAEAELAAVRAALDTARDYVASALTHEREAFKGYEHCSDIDTIEADLAAIDAARGEGGQQPPA